MSKIIFRCGFLISIIFIFNTMNANNTQAMFQDDGEKQRIFKSIKQNLETGKDPQLKQKIDLITQAKNAPKRFSGEMDNTIKEALGLVQNQDPYERARGALLCKDIGHYFVTTQGDINNGIAHYQKAAEQGDPEAAKIVEILRQLKAKREREKEEEAQQRAKETNEAAIGGIVIGGGITAVIIGGIAYYYIKYYVGR